jgi:hypothetical protein
MGSPALLVAIVSVRTKQNSATVCDMESRMKREGHGVNLRLRFRVKEGSSDRDNVLSKQGCSNREKWEYWVQESHWWFSSWEPIQSVKVKGCIVEFTLTPAAAFQDFKTEGEGKDNENSHLLHLRYMPEKWWCDRQKGGVKAKIMKKISSQ